ncbi:MAG: DNA mismatch repair endonuclease MutL, partial [Patescibacteria group bacterium]
SKIAEESDLWKIKTMGFRGEALASISSVSKLVLRSKRNEDLGGAQLDCEGGNMISIKDVAMGKGTQIEVYDLFYNTPARQKYLKQTSTELTHISGMLNNIALANPGVALKLTHGGRVIFDLPKAENLYDRVADIFGRATAEAMLPIFYGGSSMQIDGFIGKPLLSRSTSNHQYFFVNGRAVQNYVLANAIKNAYHSMLMEDKKPVFVINIKIDPALVDVNVHPRKIEVRFEDLQEVIRILFGAVKTSLEKNSLAPKGYTESQRYMSDSFPKNDSDSKMNAFVPTFKNNSGGGYRMSDSNPAPTMNFQEALDFSKAFLTDRATQPLSENNLSQKPVMKSISQVFNSYIVAENEEGLVLIDQHAAHERVRYEQLMEQFENQQKSIQPLLVPFQLELSAQEIGMIEENKETFEKLGFEIEPFGGNTFVIHGVPTFLVKEDLNQVIKGVLDDIANNKTPTGMQGKIEEILTYMSCRSAIKFGQKLSLDEMQGLLQQMQTLKRPYTCPHGRPTMIHLTLDELAKMFGRK